MARKTISALVTWLLIGVTVLYGGYKTSIYILRVDGGYSSWSPYGSCSASCGGGIQSRTRTCTSPIPKFGGKKCSLSGPAIETVICNSQHCAIDGKYGDWSKFDSCNVKCGEGVKKRERKCNNPEPQYGGKDCKDQGPDVETEKCHENPCPVDGKYGSWGDFGECSASCGGGTQTRERKCNAPAPQHGGKDCTEGGPDKESKPCNEHSCPVNGRYSDWSVWTACSATCGAGKKLRTRECSNPSPSNNGKTCKDQGLGEPLETVECTVQECSNTVISKS